MEDRRESKKKEKNGDLLSEVAYGWPHRCQAINLKWNCVPSVSEILVAITSGFVPLKMKDTETKGGVLGGDES